MHCVCLLFLYTAVKLLLRLHITYLTNKKISKDLIVNSWNI